MPSMENVGVSATAFRDRDGSISMQKSACLHIIRSVADCYEISNKLRNRNRAILNVRFVLAHNGRFIVMRALAYVDTSTIRIRFA